jgi:hypothetical protein
MDDYWIPIEDDEDDDDDSVRREKLIKHLVDFVIKDKPEMLENVRRDLIELAEMAYTLGYKEGRNIE